MPEQDPATLRPPYRLVYLDELGVVPPVLSPTTGTTPDEVLKPVADALALGPIGGSIAYQVLRDLDVLAAHPVMLQRALAYDAGLRAIWTLAARVTRDPSLWPR
jgi:hypothetical protein